MPNKHYFKVVLATVMKVTKFVEHKIQGTHGCFDLDISHITPKINNERNTFVLNSIYVRLRTDCSHWIMVILTFDISTKKQYRSSPPIWVHV